ncbi:MAG TPA: hypothetical protein VNQ76_20730 [Planctomicrobium sp.]|nr:hypothetical protein [Planctomicrobium sp.]
MARIFVHEPTSLWTAELERTFATQRDVSFRWHPHASDLLNDASQADVMVLVVSPEDASLDLIRGIRSRNSAARLICLVNEEEPDWEHLARECGVTSILPDVSVKFRVIELIEQLLSVSASGGFH